MKRFVAMLVAFMLVFVTAQASILVNTSTNIKLRVTTSFENLMSNITSVDNKEMQSNTFTFPLFVTLHFPSEKTVSSVELGSSFGKAAGIKTFDIELLTSSGWTKVIDGTTNFQSTTWTWEKEVYTLQFPVAATAMKLIVKSVGTSAVGWGAWRMESVVAYDANGTAIPSTYIPFEASEFTTNVYTPTSTITDGITAGSALFGDANAPTKEEPAYVDIMLPKTLVITSLSICSGSDKMPPTKMDILKGDSNTFVEENIVLSYTNNVAALPQDFETQKLRIAFTEGPENWGITELELEGYSKADYQLEFSAVANAIVNDTLASYKTAMNAISNCKNTDVVVKLMSEMTPIISKWSNYTDYTLTFNRDTSSVTIFGETISESITATVDGVSIEIPLNENGAFEYTYVMPVTTNVGSIIVVVNGVQKNFNYEKKSSQKQINSFILDGVLAAISGSDITVRLPYTADITSLISAFEVSEGATVKVGDVVQQNGKTTNDYSNPVVFTVIAEDLSQISYTVTVTKLPKPTERPTSSGGGKGGGGNSIVIKIPPIAEEKPISPPTATLRFNDIATHWAKGYIEQLASKGIAVKSESFNPDSSITRVEFLAFIVRAFNYTEAANIAFDDVPSGMWFEDVVKKAYAAGIAKGISGDTFGASESLTRQDAAVMLARVLKATSNNQPDFTDSKNISEYAIEAVAALSKMGVVNGYDDGNFLPMAYITRAEAAKIINLVIK